MCVFSKLTNSTLDTCSHQIETFAFDYCSCAEDGRNPVFNCFSELSKKHPQNLAESRLQRRARAQGFLHSCKQECCMQVEQDRRSHKRYRSREGHGSFMTTQRLNHNFKYLGATLAVFHIPKKT